MKGYNLVRSALTVLFFCALSMQVHALNGRIAVSADGNQHDADDIGATPATLALGAAWGLQEKFVHYDYASHIWDNRDAQEAKIEESALTGGEKFGYDPAIFVNAYRETNRAVTSATAAINASSEDDSLYFIVAGPMEIAYRALDKADTQKRKFVRVISHSAWNNNHGLKNHNGYDDDAIKALGIYFDQIRDQNGGFSTGRDTWGQWTWLKNANDPNLRWVYSRMEVVGRPDISDMGMLYYLMTGEEQGGVTELKDVLLNPTIASPWMSERSQPASLHIRSGELVVSGAATGLVRIFNPMSRLVRQGMITNGSVRIDLSGATPGHYIALITSNGLEIRQSFMLR